MKNEGTGGGNCYYWFDRDLGKKICAWAESQTLEFDFEKLDQIIDDLVLKIEATQELTRYCKKETLFRLRGDKKGSWRSIKGPCDPKILAFLQKKYGSDIECIANQDIPKAAEYC